MASPRPDLIGPLIVNGEWINQLYIRMIEPSDYNRVIDYMILNYAFEEPVNRWLATNRSFGLPEEYISDYTQFLLLTLPQKLSLVAIDMKTNNIAGVRLTKLRTLAENSNTPYFHFESKGFQALCTFKSFLEKKADLYNRFDVSSYPDMTGVSVDKPYRRQGLLIEMYARSLELYKSLGHTVVKTVFLNPISQRAGLRLGFTELSRAYYSEFRNENGYLLFPKFEHPEWFAPLMVSIL